MISDDFLNPMKWPVLTQRGTTRCTTGICLIALLVATPAGAQTRAASPLSPQVAMERAFAANPTIAAARLIREFNLAGFAVARERLNPEAIVEFEKETPKQGFGLVLYAAIKGRS
jgi:hypothetical protein